MAQSRQKKGPDSRIPRSATRDVCNVRHLLKGGAKSAAAKKEQRK